MRFRPLFTAALTVLSPALVLAQGTSVPPTPPRITVPTVTVTAQKEPSDAQTLPISLSPVPIDPLWNGGLTTLGEFSIYAPNTSFTDFSARKLSNPRFRGVGSSPANPAISTYIDGVPQLNTNSSSIELLDVSQIEYVRGPQSALFGRNTLGGLVNVTSVRPSLTKWSGSAIVPYGNYDSVDLRASASGPIGSKAAVGFAIGHSARAGFTTNDASGHDVDSRSATFGKAQFLFTPGRDWEARFIYTGERARDGDYALNDLQAVRDNPFHVSRDFEGHTDRDVNAATVLARHGGQKVSFTSTTGFVKWKTLDATDLDYSPHPLVTRENDEQDFQFTQEARFASGPAGALTLGAASLRWQAGIFAFTQDYDQTAVNTIAPFVLSPFITIPVHQYSPIAELNDAGIGVYGDGTFSFKNRFDVTVGARFDHEDRDALQQQFIVELTTMLPPVKQEKSFSNVSPQFSFAYHVNPDAMAYFSVTNGFKAGGFNPAAPQGSEAYGEEHSWSVEGGVKSAFAGRRITTNVSVFSIDWQDLQLNVPYPFVPGQFYISNVGGARSSGVEAEVRGRAREGVDLFGGFGYTHARFGDNTSSGGVAVGGNRIPNTPDYTFVLGTDLSHVVNAALRVYGRAEAVFYGAFKYDEANTQGQDAYSLTNLRAGLRGKRLFAEFWTRNAFDTKYVPVAFAYAPLAPSGFIAEPGRPRTFGVTAGVTF